jgi:gliding motility-associated-like protein
LLRDRIIILVCFVLPTSLASGQNVLLNSFFSEIDPNQTGNGCTGYRAGFELPNRDRPTHWYSPQDSFDLLTWNAGWHCHDCQTAWGTFGLGAKPGYNPFPMPKKGLGYAQLNLLVGFNGLLERGFISQKLQAPLVSGETYTIEFYVRTFKWSMKLCSNLGVLFTADSLDYFAFKQNLTPDFEMGYLHSDTTQWTRILSTYVANGTEQFFNMGNFRHDTATNAVNSGYPLGPLPFSTYNTPSYLIDAVMLYRPEDTLYTAKFPYADTLLCPGEQLVLQPELQGFMLEDTTTTYLWSTSSTDSSIVVTAPGTYWVQTTINSRFVAGDTIVVDYFPANYALSLPDTVTFCEGDQAIIQATTLPSQYSILTVYLWNTGSTLTGIQVRNPGLFWLTAQTPCSNLADSSWAVQDFCESYLWVPNAFTPDGDGINEYFAFQGAPQPVTLYIFDRWGKRVFFSDNYQNNWDGSCQGQPLPADVYTYLIEYEYVNPNGQQQNPDGSKRQVRGTVSIIR